jgi:putative PEP-CTERM system TPR-repeat lipoprotein
VDPENVAAKLGIVSSYLSESNYIQSRSTLDEVLSAHPESVEAWLASGDLNMRLRRFLDAGSNFEKTLELLPDEGDTGLVLRGLNGLAESQLALGENDNARQTVARLVDLAPESIVALHLSARIAFLDEDWKTTQLNLQRVLQIAPNFEPAKMLLGMAHLNSGNLAKAEMYLSAAVANTPSNMEARMLLAETRAQLQRVDLVNETLRPMLSGQNKNPRALAIAGRASMESGDIDEGISYLEQSVAADPDSNQLKLLLAAAYISSDRQAEAKEILDTFDAGSATDDEYRREMLQAAALFKDGEVAAAIEVAQLVSGRWPEKGEIQNLLGTFYLTQQDQLPSLRFLAAIDRIEGHLDAARLRYLDVLEQKPGTVWALVALARIAIDSENVAEARKFLEEARSSDSTAVEPRVLLANMYLVEEDFRSAEVVAKEAIELNPNIASLHNTLGLAALNQRRFKEAAESFQTAVSMAEQNDDFRLNLARAQGALGDTASAEKTLETSLEREVADISSAGMLIALKVDEGEFDEALLLARNLQQMHPEEQAPLAFEGEVHINKGDLGEAIRVYERALALGPNRNIALRAHALIRREGSGDEFRPLLDYLDQRPLDSVARLILAQAYERDSQLDKAVQQYETVVEGEPDNA